MEKKENWQIILTHPAEKIYKKSDREIKKRFNNCFEELENDPFYGINIKPLTGKLRGLYRYRVGDWRVIYRIFRETKVVEIIAILPRGNAY
jgi:mRNA interferase RelE/StbE